jgi:hypothetical protein
LGLISLDNLNELFSFLGVGRIRFVLHDRTTISTPISCGHGYILVTNLSLGYERIDSLFWVSRLVRHIQIDIDGDRFLVIWPAFFQGSVDSTIEIGTYHWQSQSHCSYQHELLKARGKGGKDGANFS